MDTIWRKVCIYGIPPLAVLIGTVIFQVNQGKQTKTTAPAPTTATAAAEQTTSPPWWENEDAGVTKADDGTTNTLVANTQGQETENTAAVEPTIQEPPLTLQMATRALTKLASGLSNSQLWSQWLEKSDIIVRFVRLLDDISNGDRPMESADFLRSQQPFSTTRNQAGARVISPDTSKRYDFAIDVFCSLQPDAVAELYPRLEPALQEALEKLGYRDRIFRELLTSACTAILITPIVEEQEPLRCLGGTEGICQWENQSLEELTDAQKLFLRLGAKNTTRVRKHLQLLADALELYAKE